MELSGAVVCLVEPSFFGVGFVKEAKRLGCQVVVVVSDRDNPARYGYEGCYDDIVIADIRDSRSIYEAIKGSGHSAVNALISATDYALAVTAEAAERLGLGGMSLETASLVRNKDLARIRFRERGVPSAEFRTVTTLEEATAAASGIGYPVVFKPANTASSQNVFFISDSERLAAAFPVMTEFTTSYMGFGVKSEYLIEEYLDGPEFSVEIFVSKGVVVFAEVTEKMTSPLPYFVELAHVFPTSVLPDRKQAMIELASLALAAVGLVDGPAHVELKWTRDGPRIIEVNGRPGGDNISSDLMPAASGVNVFRAAILNALGLPPELEAKTAAGCAVGFICAERAGILKSLDGLEDVLRDESIIRASVGVEIGAEVVAPKSSDDRLGYIIVREESPALAKQKILDLIGRLRIVVE
ncbi:MAG: ATP-grasp domain-containing protein [Propionibacteriaceae bacterium]|jgi:biotin carboxylase|nr:ATP-grasp domain-containing protein [Propionibacteriaceae bacterium]